MKRYTVKEVIKMQDKAQYLANIDSERRAEEYFMPLCLLGSLGLAVIVMTAKTNANQLIPLLTGSASSIYGYGSLVHYFSAGKRSDKMYDKLHEIYNFMGNDFVQKLEEERIKIENEKIGKNR